ncbi:MAG: hypothetical protein JW797_06425 [Bradymonadales bacterium]|nr:hypothetical protein [Bradymonadales bacterium]
MTSIAQHIRIRLANDRVIAPTTEERRLVARLVLAQGQMENLLCFGLADCHLHLEAVCEIQAGLQLARRIELSLFRRLGLNVRFAPAYVEPIRDIRHLANTFDYILGQSRHHGLNWDPLHEATNLPDLIGMRLIGRYTIANVRRYLPRVSRKQLLGHLGIPDLQPSEGPLERIVEAVLAATALSGLQGKSRELAEARRALVAVVGRRMTAARLAPLVGVSPQMITRLRHGPVNQELVQAIQLQLGLLSVLGDQYDDHTPYLGTDPTNNGIIQIAARIP